MVLFRKDLFQREKVKQFKDTAQVHCMGMMGCSASAHGTVFVSRNALYDSWLIFNILDY